MRATRINKKGQITIPIELRRKLRLRPGTLVSLRDENGRVILISTKRLLDEIRGCLKPGPGEFSAFDMLFEERKRERIREDRKALR
jgi:AbrB family looped-hinge helix DNA binding protein